MDNTGRRITITVAAFIVALTGAAFWLSYAHLQGVAYTYGLSTSVSRSWAWPATLDMFIVIGELLMLRAAVMRTGVDKMAYILTVSGSIGSVSLNIAGVQANSHFLNYVVAAVPPTAALLAFTALMRQLHILLASEVSAQDTQVSEPETPQELSIEPEETVEEARVDKMTPSEIRLAIEDAHRRGLSVRKAAVLVDRSPSTVGKVYARLNKELSTEETV